MHDPALAEATAQAPRESGRLRWPPALSAGGLVWLAALALVLLAWGALWAMSAAALPAGLTWADLCAGTAGYGALAAMWAVMAAAMMAPTFAPALATFTALPRPAGRPAEAAGLVAGYLAVWAGASLGFAALQSALGQAALLDATGRSLSAPLSAALLLLAGLWQFTALKAACLDRCRMPLTLFLERWRPGPGAAVALGARMGADCLGCCWALMLLAFVGGMGSLLFMGLATLLMVLEKLPDIGRPLTRPLGVALLAAGVAVLAGWLTG